MPFRCALNLLRFEGGIRHLGGLLQRFPMASRMRLSFSIVSDRGRRNSPSGTYEGRDSRSFQPFDDFLGLINPSRIPVRNLGSTSMPRVKGAGMSD
jgi:hypothetical protein